MKIKEPVASLFFGEELPTDKARSKVIARLIHEFPFQPNYIQPCLAPGFLGTFGVRTGPSASRGLSSDINERGASPGVDAGRGIQATPCPDQGSGD